MTVDVFENVAIVSLYQDFSSSEEASLLNRLGQTGCFKTAYLKRRPKTAKRAAGEEAEHVAPKEPAWGAASAHFSAQEDGVRFEIRPDNGLSVGLYLDSRDARGWVKHHARGRTVLNCFAYTCGFGLSAALNGATRVVNVDLSRKVLDWGSTNYRLNQLTPHPEDFIAGDVFEWLRRLDKKGEQFSMIVLDPPGFSTANRSRFSAATQYQQLVAAAAPLLAADGLLLAMCNVAKLSSNDFKAQVSLGLQRRRHVIQSAFSASAIDFAQPAALKCLALSVF